MKTMKVNFRNLFSILVLGAALLTTSCGWLFSSEVEDGEELKNGKGYLNIKVNDDAKRTIKPQGYNKSDFKNVILYGTYLEGRANEITLASVNSIADLEEEKPELETGRWVLKLTASCNGVAFSATKQVTVFEGNNNSVSFTLEAEETLGGFKISFDLTDSGIVFAKASLKKAKNKALVCSDTWEIDPEDTDKIFTFKRFISEDDTSEGLTAGTYIIAVEFYTNKDDPTPANNWENYIVVKAGLTTEATIPLVFNSADTITYDYNGGELASGLVIEKYTVRSSFTLPVAKKAGNLFMGWEIEGTGEVITTIKKGTSGPLTLKAKFLQSITVSSTGSIKTIKEACQSIINSTDPTTERAILIEGEITETDLDEIPSELTNEHASAIYISGANGLDENGEPKDSLNRGVADSSNGVSNGTVFTINSEVPVTITNLKITGGYGGNGGGMYISPDSTVILGDGVLITNNRTGSNGVGGGICNEGTLYMYGTAVVGDKTNGGKVEGTAFTYGKDSSSSDDQKNKTRSNYGYSGGGGIYNGNKNDSSVIAKLYLGYKPDTNGNPKKEELKGGLYYNGGVGGGLYNAAGSITYFDSGTFAWNGSSEGGGAIMNAGTIEMTGGLIEHNRTTGTNAAYGGAINNKSNAKFIMSGGTINHNIAFRFYSYGDLSYGGAVYNQGQFFMYGDAVIGDKDATTIATGQYEDSEQDNVTNNVTAWGNKAYRGGAIYGDGQGSAIYIGYKPNESTGEPEEAELLGGIYYNYASYAANTTDTSSQYGGGAIESSGTLKIASGTIAYNSTNAYGGAIRYTHGNNCTFEISGGTIKNNIAKTAGGAIYLATNSVDELYLSGNPVIPADIKIEGFNNYIHDIYVCGQNTRIKLTSALPDSFASQVTFSVYNTDKAHFVTEDGVSFANEYTKFTVTDENLNGRTKKWALNETGFLTEVINNLYVSADGQSSNSGETLDTALDSITSAISRIRAINNSKQDYTIYVSGTINGAQTIADIDDKTIPANSLILKGKTGLNSTTNLPQDTLNGNFGTTSGTTLTINTKTPVAIKELNIAGSNRTDTDSFESGLSIINGSTVSFENTSVISGNSGGVYVDNSTFIIDGGIIKNNTGKNHGAGIYATESNIKMISGSIADNSFNTTKTRVYGGGLYLNNSTFEMTGGTISNNGSANSGVTVNGKGIYVSSDSTFNIGAIALINLDNDVYLDNNVKVNVISDLKEGSSRRGETNPAAMLTPAIYPTQNTEGNITANVELLNIAEDLYMYNVAKQFRITPQKIGEDLQYWKIDSTSTNAETYGKFIKISGTKINIVYTTGVANDIEVTVTNAEGGTVEKNISYAGGGTIIFTATEGYSSYKWKLENEVQTTSPANLLQVNTSNWDAGVYDLVLEVRDSSGSRCSYTAQIKVSSN